MTSLVNTKGLIAQYRASLGYFQARRIAVEKSRDDRFCDQCFNAADVDLEIWEVFTCAHHQENNPSTCISKEVCHARLNTICNEYALVLIALRDGEEYSLPSTSPKSDHFISKRSEYERQAMADYRAAKAVKSDGTKKRARNPGGPITLHIPGKEPFTLPDARKARKHLRTLGLSVQNARKEGDQWYLSN